MALSPADIAVVSQLLDQALALPVEEREAWLAALPEDHRRYQDTLRDMLAQEAQLGSAPRLNALPTLAPDESVAREGDLVGPYRLIREIGRGGMGSVWLAERADGAYKRQVALKLPRLAWGAGLAERMAREREIGMLLEHPNIARLYDAGVDERGRPYLALEFIDGQPIDAWCEAQGLDIRSRLTLFVQVARAVAYAHGRLVVHRDLKPSNVLVTPDGQVHLLDFGIAKLLAPPAAQTAALTQHQGRVLTPLYASPEQLAGDPVTVQSDVYSLGVLLYELLTGTLPIEPARHTLGAMEEAILAGEAAPASHRVSEPARARALRGEVDAILGRAMHLDLARRYVTAEALAQDIERHLAGETVSARPDSTAYRMRKAVRRHLMALGATVAVAAALASGGTVALIQAQRAAQQAERANLATQFVTELFRAGSRPPPASGGQAAPTLLDKGAQLIQTRFPGQPDLQAELFGVVGRAYADLGANQAAIEFAGRELKLLDSLAADGARRAGALMLLARISMNERLDEDAERYASQALGALSPDDELWADAQVLLARVQQRRGKLAPAREAVTRLERALVAGGRSKSAAMAWTHWLQGDLTDDLDQRLALRRQALEVVRLPDGSVSLDAVEMQLALAGALTSLNRPAEAAPYRDAALAALRSLGGTHAVRAALEEASQWGFRCNLGEVTHAQALQGIARSRAETAASALSLPPIVAARLDWAQGDCELRWGHLDAADRLFAAAAPALLEGRQSLPDRIDVASHLGWVASLLGQHDTAEAWLREWLQLLDQRGMSRHGFTAYAWAFLAMNDVMAGRLDAARKVLDGAPVFQAVSADPTYGEGYARVLPALRARLQLEGGDALSALKAMPALDPNRTDEQSTFPEYALRGEIECALGRTTEGGTTLQRAIDNVASGVGEQDAGLARMRSVAGLCALAAGRRGLAAEMAAAARTALDAHERLSPWFGRPLAELERRLTSR